MDDAQLLTTLSSNKKRCSPTIIEYATVPTKFERNDPSSNIPTRVEIPLPNEQCECRPIIASTNAGPGGRCVGNVGLLFGSVDHCRKWIF